MGNIKGKVEIRFTEEEYAMLTTSNTFINHEVDNIIILLL